MSERDPKHSFVAVNTVGNNSSSGDKRNILAFPKRRAATARAVKTGKSITVNSHHSSSNSTNNSSHGIRNLLTFLHLRMLSILIGRLFMTLGVARRLV